MKTFTALLLSVALAGAARAATTIDAANAEAYGANIGWVNWRGDVTNGAVIGEFICSGYTYSANCGWINLGNGTPANGIRYQNNSAADFGVNTQDYSSDGTAFVARLRGFAYGANIGWVNFEANGDPRVDLTTGRLLGYAYGANVGWIALGGTGVTVITTSIVPGADTDGDGIPDAWELLHAGNLTKMNATTDSDHDGVLDKDEYLADTDPLDPSDHLRVTSLVPPQSSPAFGGYVASLTWTSKPTREYSIETNPDLVSVWGTAASNIVPSAGITTTLSFLDIQAAQRFYRVWVKRPLVP